MNHGQPVTLPSPVAPTAHHNRSTLWAQAVRVGCKIVSVVVLARLVSPAEHGLFAMAASVTLMLLLFRDVGLGTASVQVASLSEIQRHTLLVTHLALGASLMVLTWLLAPLAAWFYGADDLLPLLATMSVAFFFIGAGGFPRSQLVRGLRFAELARIDAITASVATAAMIAAGALGAGAYSFAAFLIASESIAAALAWRAYPCWPRFPVEFRSLRRLIKTGAHVTGYHVVNQFIAQLDTLAIGHVFGAYTLGLYYRPAQLLSLGNQHVGAPLGQVSLATLSRLTADPERFRRSLHHAVMVTAHLSLPLTTLCLVLPQEIVRLVLGRQWLEATTVLQLLTFTAAANMVTILAFGVNVAAGQSRRLLVSVLASLPLTAVAIFLGVRHGAAGVAAALAIVNLGLLWPRLWWMLRDTPIGVSTFLSALTGPLAVNVVLGLGLVIGRWCVAAAAWPVRLAVALLGGAVAAAVLTALWPRLRTEGHELLAHLPWRKEPPS